jgi:hypothetical protein
MFGVHVINDEGVNDIKSFETLAGADVFAKQCVQSGGDAKVYNAPGAKDAYAVKAAIEMGCGELVSAPTRKLSDRERSDLEKRESARELKELLELADKIQSGRVQNA